VALLDAVSDWRAQVRRDAPPDPRYGAAFQGWFSGAVPDAPFEVTLAGPSLRRCVAWVISAGARVGRFVTRIDDGSGKIAVQVNPAFQAVLAQWQGAAPIVSMIQGNEHARFMLDAWPAYDFLDASVEKVRADVPLIDTAFIDERIDAWVDAVFLSLSVLRHLAANPLAHVLPPPPRENPGGASHFEALSEETARYGFAPDALRLKWYRRYGRRLAERLARIGCTVLEAPAEACTTEGLLSERFAEGLTHGNAAYGALVARQIDAWIHRLRA